MKINKTSYSDNKDNFIRDATLFLFHNGMPYEEAKVTAIQEYDVFRAEQDAKASRAFGILGNNTPQAMR